MTANKPMDSYDEIKGMLSKVRKIQLLAKINPYGLIKEQIDSEEGDDFSSLQKSVAKYPYTPEKPDTQPANNPTSQPTNNPAPENSGQPGESEDIMVINNVEVEIHSEDPEDLQLSDEEKNLISQLIDDFRAEVSEIAEFDKLHVYNDNAKLDGRISNIGLNFTLSTGNDVGLYLSNASLLKIDDNSLNIINKLRGFEQKFSNSINDLLVNRSST